MTILFKYITILTLTTCTVITAGIHFKQENKKKTSRFAHIQTMGMVGKAGKEKEKEGKRNTTIEIQQDFHLLATRAASLCGVPKEIFFKLINTESSWRHYRNRGNVLESSSGALGLTQIKPSSAREVSRGLNIFEPWGNLVAGACLLSKYKGNGSWREALHSYNEGPWRKGTKDETKLYADKILGEVEE
jgi:hypothetical protein